MRDALLLVDVITDFRHEDGVALLRSFRQRQPALAASIRHARRDGVPVIYANDNRGIWDGNAPRLVGAAIACGLGGSLVSEIAPRELDRFVVKPRYSAFDHTPLDLILESLDTERILLAGMTTEGCVTQTAIAARELGFKVTLFASACATLDEEVETTAIRYLEDVAGVLVGPRRSTHLQQARPELHTHFGAAVEPVSERASVS
jgi:nicotinamidase-related amidase